MAKKHKNAEHWKEAKKTFRLNDDQIAMAKELGMNPRKFGGYASTKGKPWKRPLGEFIEKCHEKRFKKKKGK